MDVSQFTRAIKAEAGRLGFDHCRIASIARATHGDFFDCWLEVGNAGEMAYLARDREKRRWPALLAEESTAPFRSIIVLIVNHYQVSLPPHIRDDPSRGLIASYAWGDDYHDVIRPRLHALDAFIRDRTGRKTLGKCLVDTGPVLERDWAMAAGLGFTGKNCCTIHPGSGSWLLLATIMTPDILRYDSAAMPVAMAEPSADQVLAGLAADQDHGAWTIARSDSSQATGTCGRCTRCLDACPTDAFVGPYHLNPQRCISYWTIESRRPIPRELRPAFGNRIFGCDICQEVCPWNQRLPEQNPSILELQAQPSRMAPPLLEGFSAQTPYWTDQVAFSAHFRRSPIKRAKRAGMLRNVCVALGNWADPVVAPALHRALRDEAPLGRGHAAWALGAVLRRHQMPEIRAWLAQQLELEGDAWVQEELRLALDGN